jgi:hypothetical protein
MVSMETGGRCGGGWRWWWWCRADLAKANKNRAQRPWVIVLGHRPMYTTSDPGSDAIVWPHAPELLRCGEGVKRSGVEWSGVEWSGAEWSGAEWSGAEWSRVHARRTVAACHKDCFNFRLRKSPLFGCFRGGEHISWYCGTRGREREERERERES